MNTILILLALAVISLIFSLMTLVKVVYYSKRASLRILGGVREHKKWVDRFLWSLILPVAFIESVVRIQEGRWGSNVLFIVHLYLVLFFVLTLFLMRVVWTGVSNSPTHKILSKCFFISFLAVAITGSILIAQLFTGN